MSKCQKCGTRKNLVSKMGCDSNICKSCHHLDTMKKADLHRARWEAENKERHGGNSSDARLLKALSNF